MGKDGAVMGVTVTRMSMNLHTQVLSQACAYSEGEIKYMKFRQCPGKNQQINQSSQIYITIKINSGVFNVMNAPF